ncbi:winged helix-turn-helix transcriptional regulator [Nocardia vermiculata]|uniref:Transcriptional regulator n=1 Tax=Nocardia vermiculata TaxID=257274 RepID=A0A846Y2F8_9NOCA|nr:winged helix-turn-helix transcriptional regulator [Nocardia vermiculata]NKY52375.1 transcriptional regulator [Nocardia vermiculata]
MARRSYDQYCGLAQAMDVVGERWTLLMVRELMSGPKRYSDLAGALDGIGTSLLAARVKQLEADGLVRRTLLNPPVSAVAYELTGTGRELGRALMPLALWGARHFLREQRRPEQGYRAEWSLVFLADLLDPQQLNTDATYEFHIDDSVARLRISDGRAEVIAGAGPADATLRTDAATVAAIAGGRLTIAAAAAENRLEVDGDPEALQALLVLLDGALSRLDLAGVPSE